MSRKKDKTFNIYYIEDNEEDFENFYSVLEKLNNAVVYPEPDDWEVEKDEILKYIHDAGKNRDNTLKLLTRRRIDLFILDERLSNDNAGGTRIYEELLRNNPKFPSLKVIILTKSDPPPTPPPVDKKIIRVCFKYDFDLKKSTEELLFNIKSLTGIKPGILAAVDTLLKDLKNFISERS